MRAKLLFLALVPLMTACAPGGGDIVGPCVHEYVGPVLVLDEATFDGRPVDRVEIVSVREGYRDFDIAAEAGSVDSPGLELGPGGRVTCTLPCGFGEVPGRWRVTVVGPDGSTGEVDTRADYQHGGGNCPSSSYDGSEVAVTLRSPSLAP